MNKLRKMVGILLIICGIGIISNVAIKKIVTYQKQKDLIEIFKTGITEGQASHNGDVNLNEANGYKPIAIIEIPSINLTQGLVEGISDDVLKYYLGHFPNSAMPGDEGNFTVAGHRVSEYTDAFINLYKVKEGDEIIVKTKEKKVTYLVEDSFIVNPDRVEVLDNTKDATVTLVTCTVGAKQRVIVKGKLKSIEDIEG